MQRVPVPNNRAYLHYVLVELKKGVRVKKCSATAIRTSVFLAVSVFSCAIGLIFHTSLNTWQFDIAVIGVLKHYGTVTEREQSQYVMVRSNEIILPNVTYVTNECLLQRHAQSLDRAGPFACIKISRLSLDQSSILLMFCASQLVGQWYGVHLSLRSLCARKQARLTSYRQALFITLISGAATGPLVWYVLFPRGYTGMGRTIIETALPGYGGILLAAPLAFALTCLLGRHIGKSRQIQMDPGSEYRFCVNCKYIISSLTICPECGTRADYQDTTWARRRIAIKTYAKKFYVVIIVIIFHSIWCITILLGLDPPKGLMANYPEGRVQLPLNWLRVQVWPTANIHASLSIRAGQFIEFRFGRNRMWLATAYGETQATDTSPAMPVAAWAVAVDPSSRSIQRPIYSSKYFAALPPGNQNEELFLSDYAIVFEASPPGIRIALIGNSLRSPLHPEAYGLLGVLVRSEEEKPAWPRTVPPTSISQTSNGLPRNEIEQRLANELSQVFLSNKATMYLPEHWSSAPWWKRDDEAERKKWGW